MKFFAYLALLSTASAADCTAAAVANAAGDGYEEELVAGDGAPVACTVVACAAGVTADTYVAGTTAPCAPAAADPNCPDTGYTCTDTTANTGCTVDADSSACTYVAPTPSADPDCPDTGYTCTDATANTGCTVDADSSACTYKAPADPAPAAATGCTDPATDCTDATMVCQTNAWGEADTAHADYTADLETSTKAPYPITACATADACAEAVTANDAADTWYTITISCGATKLVAGFAALALASAM